LIHRRTGSAQHRPSYHEQGPLFEDPCTTEPYFKNVIVCMRTRPRRHRDHLVIGGWPLSGGELTSYGRESSGRGCNLLLRATGLAPSNSGRRFARKYLLISIFVCCVDNAISMEARPFSIAIWRRIQTRSLIIDAEVYSANQHTALKATFRQASRCILPPKLPRHRHV